MSDPGSENSPEGAALAVLDIDGVLADVSHRLHHITGPRRDWSAFFAEVDADGLLDAGARAAHEACGQGLRIVYLTGRPERCRSATQAWLDRMGLPDGPVHMRPDQDRRPARRFKVERLRDLAASAPVAFLLDDDQAVCDAASEAGFTVRHADWVERADALRRAQDVTGRS